MPKSRISLILLALLAGVGLAGVTSPVSLSAAGEPNEPDQAAIQKLMEAQQAAWNHGDIDASNIEVTVDDPKAYTRPWSVTLRQQFAADTELIDEICAEGERFAKQLK